ncbi:immunity protein YezG family protein [Anaerotignum lactatifermentans]|uniref:immunity protein YezG family protein n=1 Tax=Anaerotignum lactatifermentans TaxID=160404 RepID=UPI001874F8C6|nr:immunity protein YezG family protein [Anaerotignum lactatifermentans]MBE5077615.1 DUF600 family protein [Anaerotignum lactatifermentans]
MEKKMFQEIFGELQDFLPNKWRKFVLYIAYTKGSYSMKFYIKPDNNKYLDCFSIKNIDRMNLIKAFMKIDGILSVERNKKTSENRWNVLTMVVDEAGNMRTEFDYANIEENTIAYENEWKKRYLII